MKRKKERGAGRKGYIVWEERGRRYEEEGIGDVGRKKEGGLRKKKVGSM
jgi:hypothetical protein